MLSFALRAGFVHQEQFFSRLSTEPYPAKGLELLEGAKKFLVSQKLAKSDFKLTDWAVTEK